MPPRAAERAPEAAPVHLKYTIRLTKDSVGDFALSPPPLSATIPCFGGPASRRPRVIERRNSAAVLPNAIFPYEIRSTESPEETGVFLDTGTLADCSDHLLNLLENAERLNATEHQDKRILLPFPLPTLRAVTDAMYTKELRMESLDQLLEYLHVASYLQAPELVRGLLDYPLFRESSLEPYWAWLRWVFCRHALRTTLPPDLVEPLKAIEGRCRSYLARHFDVAMVNMTKYAIVDGLDASIFDSLWRVWFDLSDVEALLKDPELRCCNEDNVLRLLKEIQKYLPGAPSLPKLCRDHLRPELLHPAVLTDLIEGNALGDDLRPWLCECLRYSLARYNTPTGAPAPHQGRSPAPSLPFTVEVKVDGMELWPELKHQCEEAPQLGIPSLDLNIGCPFLVASELYLMSSIEDGKLKGFFVAIQKRHETAHDLYGGLVRRMKAKCPYITGESMDWGRFAVDGTTTEGMDLLFGTGNFIGTKVKLDQLPAFPLPEGAPPPAPVSLTLTYTIHELNYCLGTPESLQQRPLPPEEPLDETEEDLEPGDEQEGEEEGREGEERLRSLRPRRGQKDAAGPPGSDERGAAGVGAGAKKRRTK